MKTTMTNNISTGNAGEYFVAGELERRGFTVGVPMSNVEKFDILAINRRNGHQFAVQVKTTASGNKRWTLTSKNEEASKETNKVYIFVSLHETGMPEYHIVPWNVVAKEVKESHKKWLKSPGKKGQPHKDNPIRNFEDKQDKYLNKWEYLDTL